MSRSCRISQTVVAAIWLAACASAPSTEPAAPTEVARASETANKPLRVQSFAGSERGFYVTSTLIQGEKEALLIDAQFLNSDAERLVDMVKASGKALKAVYITHAHPDHYFGLPVVRAAFPEVKVLAHPVVAEEMAARFQGKHDQWKPVFGADLADTRVGATPYEAATLELEGQTIELLGLVSGDIEHTTVVVIPSAHAVVAGDVSYGGIYPWLADTDPAGWSAWRDTLARVSALKPQVVVSGHRAPGHPDSPADLQATADFITDFEAAVKASKTPEEVVKAMSAKYPSLKLPIVLQLAAKAAFGGPH